MKRAVFLFLALGCVGALLIAAPAGAYTTGIVNLPWVYSPLANVNASNPLDDVFINQWSSILIAGGNSVPTYNPDVDFLYDWYQPADEPAPGFMGVGVPVAVPDGAVTAGVIFDAFFYSWDTYDYDVFTAVFTQGDYLWNGGIVVGTPWEWGGDPVVQPEPVGLDEPYYLDDSVTRYRMGIPVTPGTDYYLNVGLQILEGADAFPSWGRFSHVTLQVPEPATLLLVGLGLLGLAGLRRKS